MYLYFNTHTTTLLLPIDELLTHSTSNTFYLATRRFSRLL